MELNNNDQQVWVTRDGYIRQILLPNGNYVETRSDRPVNKGSYLLKGNKIHFKDDTGFVRTGSIESGVLYQHGHSFFPESCVSMAGNRPCFI